MPNSHALSFICEGVLLGIAYMSSRCLASGYRVRNAASSSSVHKFVVGLLLGVPRQSNATSSLLVARGFIQVIWSVRRWGEMAVIFTSSISFFIMSFLSWGVRV